MDKASLKKAKEVLDKYLESSSRRKTQERYAILETIYSYSGLFTMFDLEQKLEKFHFVVARATLYNSVKLFIQLRLVLRHKMEGESKYEPAIGKKNHISQLCTVCGKRKEISIRSLPAFKHNISLERFTGESFDLVVYGICSICKGRQTRMLKKEQKTNRENK